MRKDGQIFVKPREGLTSVRDEYTYAPIPSTGAWVKHTRLIDRRLRADETHKEADLIECDPPVAPVAPAEKGKG